MYEAITTKVMIAKIKGKEVVYGFCSKEKNAYQDIENKTYLGSGYIFKIDNVEQSGKESYHFWIHS